MATKVIGPKPAVKQSLPPFKSIELVDESCQKAFAGVQPTYYHVATYASSLEGREIEEVTATRKNVFSRANNTPVSTELKRSESAPPKKETPVSEQKVVDQEEIALGIDEQ